MRTGWVRVRTGEPTENRPRGKTPLLLGRNVEDVPACLPRQPSVSWGTAEVEALAWSHRHALHRAVPGAPRERVLEYAERSLRAPIGGLAAGDPQIRKKILEDFALGNVEYIIGITWLPVYVTTNVTAALNGRPFREGGPATLREAVERRDPTIKTVTFTAKRVGAYDVLCVDSGMDGAGTCGWGHKWIVAKGAFVVRPP